MNKFRGALMLTVTAMIWGAAFVAQSMGMDYLGPFTFNSVRTLLAAVALVPAVVFSRRLRRPAVPEAAEAKRAYRKTLLTGGVLCGLALGAASSLQQVGIRFTTVGKAGFLTALYIVIVPLLGLFLKKRVALPVWIGVGTAAFGTYLLSVKEGFSIGTGDLLVLLCAVGFSVHILLIDRFSPRVNGLELSCVQFFTAGFLTLVIAFCVETPRLSDILRSWGPLLYTGLVSSGIGYTLQVLGQRDTPPVVASLIMSLESVFAALSGWLILGQGMTGREAAGCALVFLAVLLAQVPFDALRQRLSKKSV